MRATVDGRPVLPDQVDDQYHLFLPTDAPWIWNFVGTFRTLTDALNCAAELGAAHFKVDLSPRDGSAQHQVWRV